MIQTEQYKHHTFDNSYATIHYVTQGDPRNPLMLFVHPAFSDYSSFSQQLDYFAAHYRVVAVDLLGHGASRVHELNGQTLSMAELLGEIIKREQHQQAHVVGVSLGSLIVQDLAARLPSMVKSVTVVGGYPIFAPSSAIKHRQAIEMLKLAPFMLFSVERLRRKIARDVVIQPEAREQFYRSSQAWTRRSLRAMGLLGDVFRAEFQPATHPVLIVVGEHERELLRNEARTWRAKERLAQLHSITNAGHCANMDQPAAFNRVVHDFVSQHD